MPHQSVGPGRLLPVFDESPRDRRRSRHRRDARRGPRAAAPRHQPAPRRRAQRARPRDRRPHPRGRQPIARAGGRHASPGPARERPERSRRYETCRGSEAGRDLARRMAAKAAVELLEGEIGAREKRRPPRVWPSAAAAPSTSRVSVSRTRLPRASPGSGGQRTGKGLSAAAKGAAASRAPVRSSAISRRFRTVPLRRGDGGTGRRSRGRRSGHRRRRDGASPGRRPGPPDRWERR